MTAFFLSRHLKYFLLLICISFAVCIFAENQTLDFQQAYQYTLENAMRLKNAEAEIGMRQAEKLQQGFYPNPELNISVDGPSGTSNWSNCNNDISVGLTQLFELGGKRHARVRVASAAECETSWDLEIVKCDLYADLLHAFIHTAIAQERLALAVTLQTIAEEVSLCISKKAAYGKVSLIDEKRSEIVFKTARLIRNKQQTEVQKAKLQLATLWNCSAPQFEQVNFPLFKITPPPPYDQLINELNQNPELKRFSAELSKAWEMIELERTRRIPNMAVYLGVCTERNFHDPALSFGINIPLPIFDRNQGNISRATHLFNQVTFKQMDLINQLRTRLTIVYSEWQNAYNQASELQEIVETVAEETYQLAEEQYSLGNSSFLTCLDARTTLFNMKQQYLDAIDEYHHKRAEVLQLLAKCCPEVFNHLSK